jgi:DNA invertase Pin-like site-specific DNA recombinase
MSILHTLMEKEVKVFTTKERYELENNISSKVLAFAFSLSAEIERSMISSRTKEALARKKSEGKRLGRPKGKLSAGQEDPAKCHRPPLKRAPLNGSQLYSDSQATETCSINS